MAIVKEETAQYLNKAMPLLKLDSDLTDFVKSLLNKKKAVYNSVKVVSLSPMAKSPTGSYKEAPIVLPKLEVPVFPQSFVQTVDSTQVKSVLRHRKRRSSSIYPIRRHTKSNVTPITELDGIKYNPEDYKFSKKPSPKQGKLKRKASMPGIRKQRDKSLLNFMEIKQAPGKHRNERLRYITDNPKYAESLLKLMSNHLSPKTVAGECPLISGSDTPTKKFSVLAASMLGLPLAVRKDSKGRRGNMLGITEEYDPRKQTIGELRRKHRDAGKYGYRQINKAINECLILKDKSGDELVSNTEKFNELLEKCNNKKQSRRTSESDLCLESTVDAARAVKGLKRREEGLTQLKDKYAEPYKESQEEVELFKSFHTSTYE